MIIIVDGWWAIIIIIIVDGWWAIIIIIIVDGSWRHRKSVPTKLGPCFFEVLFLRYSALLINAVPQFWSAVSYPSLKPLASWVGNAYKHVCRHVYRHMYRHVCRRA